MTGTGKVSTFAAGDTRTGSCKVSLSCGMVTAFFALLWAAYVLSVGF
jgi:hypothetical protein